MKPSATLALILALSLPAAAADALKPPPVNPNLKPVTVEGLSWSGDLSSALADAARGKKLVFIDFTGVTCVNCKINEKKVFPKPEVKDLFEKYVRVQLYTDTIPEDFYKKAPDEAKREKDAIVNQEFQSKVLRREELPYYVIVRPAGAGGFEVVAAYDEGKITKVDKFLDFLKKPLKGE
jgi:thioredoxin-related protein